MIVKKTDTGVYIKSLDLVDSYLVNIMNRFFETDEMKTTNNIDNIINETIKRIKEDLIHLFTGVISINGMSGDVILNPTHINAEPSFNKNTAFNKDFGVGELDICRGN